MRAFFARLPFHTQLVIAFGIIAGLMFFSDMLKVVDSARNMAAIEHYFRTEDRIGSLAADSVAALEKARRLEQEFLERVRTSGGAAATELGARPVFDQLAEVRAKMAEVRTLRPDAATARSTQAVETQTLIYEHRLLRLAHLYRRAAHTARTPGAPGAPDPLAQREIDAANAQYLAAAQEIEPALAQIREQAAAAQESVRTRVAGTTSMPAMLGGFAWLVNLVAAVALLGWMTRGLRRWCAGALRFCTQLAARDWSARMPEGEGSGDLVAVARAMNGLADSLQRDSEQMARQSAVLEKANRALRMLFHCHEGMMRAATEPQLFDAVCRQLAGHGGYPLVWIGVPCHDDLYSIRPAAAAGDQANSGTDIRRLHFSWGGMPEQRGLAGEALVRERSVVARAAQGQPGELGYASGAALPLLWRGEALGVLVLYDVNEHAFDSGELPLLQDLASELSARLAGMREAHCLRVAEQATDYQNRHDPLTGLPNRSLLGERLQQATIRAVRESQRVAVLVVGLDRYRGIGAQYGANAANGLLQHAAQALTEALRDGDTVARLLGDEFAVVVGGLASPEDAMTVAAKLMAALRQPFAVNGIALSTTASVGISLHLRDGTDTATLLCCANAAMVSAQAMGGNRMRYYAPELNERAARLAALEAELLPALARGGLAVHYQPRAVLATGGIAAAEALLRWHHLHWGTVPSREFIAAAERSGLVIELGRWVLRHVCRQLRTWQDQGRQLPVVAVPVTARQFRHETLLADIRSALADFNVAPDRLELDIAESTVMHRIDDAIVRLHALRSIGVRLSLEDFGVGNSSLGRLREMPVQSLKIGQSYVRHLADNPTDAAVCGSIIALAHHLDLTVVAEGVESADSARCLREQHCDEIQGQYVAHALPPDDFAGLMARQPVMA